MTKSVVYFGAKFRKVIIAQYIPYCGICRCDTNYNITILTIYRKEAIWYHLLPLKITGEHHSADEYGQELTALNCNAACIKLLPYLAPINST